MGNNQSKPQSTEMVEYHTTAILKNEFSVGLPPYPYSFFVKKQFNEKTKMWSIYLSYQNETDAAPQPFYSFESQNDFANVKPLYDLQIERFGVHTNKITFVFDQGTPNEKRIVVVLANKSSLPWKYKNSELSVKS
jgi:hypothetical protein